MATSQPSTFRATCTCCTGWAGTSRSRSATPAFWWSIPGCSKTQTRLIAAIRKLSDKPLQYIINTCAHPDQTGGNEAVRKTGVTITGANVTGDIADAGQGAQIIAHENVLDRLSAPTGQKAAAPAGAWPTDTYVSGQKEVFFNEEPVEVRWQPAAHTDGDSLVIFRRSDVVATGDIFNTESYPFIDVERGGGIQGEIDALNNIIDIAIPKHEEEGGTYIIPGHGRICDEFDVVEYRDMVTIVRDRVQNAIKKGMTLEQVKTRGFHQGLRRPLGRQGRPWDRRQFRDFDLPKSDGFGGSK